MTQEIIEVSEEDYDLMSEALDTYNRTKNQCYLTEKEFFLQCAIGRLTWTEEQARNWLQKFIKENSPKEEEDKCQR